MRYAFVFCSTCTGEQEKYVKYFRTQLLNARSQWMCSKMSKYSVLFYGIFQILSDVLSSCLFSSPHRWRKPLEDSPAAWLSTRTMWEAPMHFKTMRIIVFVITVSDLSATCMARLKIADTVFAHESKKKRLNQLACQPDMIDLHQISSSILLIFSFCFRFYWLCRGRNCGCHDHPLSFVLLKSAVCFRLSVRRVGKYVK